MNATLTPRPLADPAVFGPVARLLHDPSVSEVLVNGFDHVFVERDGRLLATDVRFASDAHLRAFIERLVAPLGLRIDESYPMVDARLPDGSRFHAVIPPASVNGPLVSIRRFILRFRTLEHLMASGMVRGDVGRSLASALAHRQSVLVSGPTSSGKTTVLNALAACIPHTERIITIEDPQELCIAHPHVVPLQARHPNPDGAGEITLRRLVREALRMRPDRIVVGEVRGSEAVEMLTAMSTGHPGSLCTLHANSAPEAIDRLETLVLIAEPSLSVTAVRRLIAKSVQIVVHLDRTPEGRRTVREVGVVRATGAQGIELERWPSC